MNNLIRKVESKIPKWGCLGWFIFYIGVTGVLFIGVEIEQAWKKSQWEQRLQRIKNDSCDHRLPSEMSVEEMDSFREKQVAQKTKHQKNVERKRDRILNQFSNQEVQVYRFMDKLYVTYMSNPNYDPNTDLDLIVSTKAANKFGISREESLGIYIKISGEIGF
jgi:hypothetical protein